MGARRKAWERACMCPVCLYYENVSDWGWAAKTEPWLVFLNSSWNYRYSWHNLIWNKYAELTLTDGKWSLSIKGLAAYCIKERWKVSDYRELCRCLCKWQVSISSFLLNKGSVMEKFCSWKSQWTSFLSQFSWRSLTSPANIWVRQ